MGKDSFLCSWSGGKDSCFAFMQAIQQNYIPQTLLNVLNEEGEISRSHGIPSKILQAQANALNLPIHLISSSWNEYEKKFTEALRLLKAEYGAQFAVFGDIDLQAHKDWEEKVCSNAGLTAFLPIWKRDRKQLVLEMLNNGIETIIVSCNEIMGERFLGKKLTLSLIEELDTLGIDVCGENGEFHTLVVHCPLFTNRIHVEVTRTVKHEQYWFTELSLLQ